MHQNERISRGSQRLRDRDFGRWSFDQLADLSYGPRLSRKSLSEYQQGMEVYLGEDQPKS